jgi:sulfite exporter TauE/SafE
MENIDLLGFFSIGFFGGFGHCIGMCHPFVLYISGRFVAEKKGYKNLLMPHIFYNFGRIITYIILGVIAGVIGNIGQMAGGMIGLQKTAAIIAGIFLIIYAFLSFSGYNLITKLENKIATEKVMNVIKKFQPKTPLSTGIILGFLPCGLLYSALIAATSSGDFIKAGISMGLFGLGTMFALMLTSVFGNYLMAKRGIFNLISLVILMIMGAYFIYQGIKY